MPVMLAWTLLIPPILPVPSILPHVHDPAAARRVVAAVRALLADTVVKETRSDALDAVNCGTWTRWMTCASTPS